jgi:hypothetical protein
METSTGVGKGEEEQVTLADVLRRCDVILELLQLFQSRKVTDDASRERRWHQGHQQRHPHR